MALDGEYTYVGFGCGPIQAGLFLYEAFRSGHFRRLVVAEIDRSTVDEVRAAGGTYAVNVAHADRVETAQIGPVEIFDPNHDADRAALTAAVAEAHEIGTALPSVGCYASDAPGSPHRVLARGLARSERPAVVYAAENRNDAAESLQALVEAEAGPLGQRVQFLDTVIGKMSGRPGGPAKHDLAPLTPATDRAFLVESFNRILIEKIRLPGFRRGIDVFEEKDDLLPFEEAKLFGHNATHALGGYLAGLVGLEQMAELTEVPGMMPFLRHAFLDESGAALARKHRGADPLFTPAGYREYADDLLRRMTNPLLLDSVERVVRDPERKLGWSDRLVGTMRLALSQGIEPARYAAGAAAALAHLDPGFLHGRVSADALAEALWEQDEPDRKQRAEILRLIEHAGLFLSDWQDFGFEDLKHSFEENPAV
ncbi:MAG: hypothetical protein R6V58_14385 [Planctomycetota bacterium]